MLTLNSIECIHAYGLEAAVFAQHISTAMPTHHGSYTRLLKKPEQILTTAENRKRASRDESKEKKKKENQVSEMKKKM